MVRNNVAALKDHKLPCKPTIQETRNKIGPGERWECYYMVRADERRERYYKVRAGGTREWYCMVRADKGLTYAETIRTSCTWCRKIPDNGTKEGIKF